MKHILAFTTAAITATSCAPLDTREADEAEIRESYNAWVTATNARDIERWAAFLAPDAIFLPPDAPALENTEAIRDYYLKLFADPLFALDCEQLEVSVARSGESAWSRGKCHATFTGEDGSAANAASKWTKVWEKQTNGEWRNRLNTWNMDP